MSVWDVGEYADDAEALWRKHGLEAEPIGGNPVFTYIEQPGRPLTARGRILARLVFPGHPLAYMRVDEWLSADGLRIRRDSYVYQLLYDGGVLENWHRHHGSNHQHRGEGPDHERVPATTSHKGAIEAALNILWGQKVPDLGA